MPINFESLKKIDGVPALARQQPGNALGRLLILVKLRKGFAPPDYIDLRGEPAPGFFSAIVTEDKLPKLEADPTIASISISKALPVID